MTQAATSADKHASTGRYVAVWAALVGLTLLSFLLSRAHLGAAEIVFALAIAAAKTVLVLLFFMHLLEQRTTNTVVVVTAVSFVVLLASLSAADVATRQTFPPAPTPPRSTR